MANLLTSHTGQYTISYWLDGEERYAYIYAASWDDAQRHAKALHLTGRVTGKCVATLTTDPDLAQKIFPLIKRKKET